MLYASVAPNGYARVSTVPPKDAFYVEVETLPDGEGPLMLCGDGTLRRLKPEPEPEPEPTTEERVTALEESLAQTDEAAIELYEANEEQQSINAAQDEALIEIYEMLEV